MPKRAATYLRSSKDRSDVSIDAQRHELSKLASTLDLTLVAEFSDVVMSGQDDSRPGFVALKAALQRRDRGWEVLLALDTARIARDEFEQAWVHREARQQGIAIHYAKLPTTGTAADVLLLNTMRGVDRWHSIVSREKGLAGMRENVRRGFRAGGRAPIGYQLEHVPTGAIRDGAPVMKSRLVPDPERAPAIAAFLCDRVAGIGRTEAARRAGLRAPQSTLICVEWNALTYAGHTVWNVHNEYNRGGYLTGHKRRARNEWVVQRDTHHSLITTDAAELLLAALATSRHGRRSTRLETLLGGLLLTPSDQAWHGYLEDGGFYRAGKGRRIAMRTVDDMVAAAVTNHLRSKGLAASLARYGQKVRKGEGLQLQAAAIANRYDALEGKIGKLTAMLTEIEQTRPLLDRINALELERATMEREKEEIQKKAAAADLAAGITEEMITSALAKLTAGIERADKQALKRLIADVTDKIVLDPDDLSVRIHYKISVTSGASMASPRGFEPRLPP